MEVFLCGFTVTVGNNEILDRESDGWDRDEREVQNDSLVPGQVVEYDGGIINQDRDKQRKNKALGSV